MKPFGRMEGAEPPGCLENYPDEGDLRSHGGLMR